MSKVDKMFKKLGYENKGERKDEIILGCGVKTYLVYQSNARAILFNLDDKEIDCFTMQELQAINEKCKELGWL